MQFCGALPALLFVPFPLGLAPEYVCYSDYGVTACVTGLVFNKVSELSNGEVFLISRFGLSRPMISPVSFGAANSFLVEEPVKCWWILL